MGHLFSRAIKRFTQCSQSHSLPAQQQGETSRDKQSQARTSQQTERPVITSETIPVGQSIDSSDYISEPATATRGKAPAADEKKVERDPKAVSAKAVEGQEENAKPKQADGVEEAAIKIQAYVRGHLTRKALRDAQQHNAPNALGQSQFDADNLTLDPLSPIFSLIPSAPAEQNQSEVERKPRKLASIAEDSERPVEEAEQVIRRPKEELKVRLPTPDFERRTGSSSPALSEAASVSIDLNAGDSTPAPASASIDIVDYHHREGGDKMAQILHHPTREQAKTEEIGGPSVTTAATTATNNISSRPADFNGNPSNVRITMTQSADSSPMQPNDSTESEEAAAIRIQSAFRGYRTRKNSPFRTRSPSSPVPISSATGAAMSNGAPETADQAEASARRRALKQQEATDEAAGLEAAERAGRRQSRSAQRHPSAEEAPEVIQAAPSIEDELTTATTTDEATVRAAQTGTSAQADISAADDGSLAGASDFSVSRVASSGAALEPELSAAELDIRVEQQRPSIGAKSDFSVEFDTDTSSNLGALASLNEDISLVGGALEPVDELADKSLGTSLPTESELEAEARRLIEDIEQVSGQDKQIRQDTQPDAMTLEDCALEEATNQFEEALEAAVAPESGGGSLEATVGSGEQHAIEMESDDIERRDPMGQASEERTKSPIIQAEAPSEEGATGASQNVGEGASRDLLSPEDRTDDQRSTSGRSSGCGSSDDEDLDEEVDLNNNNNNYNILDQTGRQQQQRQSQQQQQRANKRRNRNKKNKANKK